MEAWCLGLSRKEPNNKFNSSAKKKKQEIKAALSSSKWSMCRKKMSNLNLAVTQIWWCCRLSKLFPNKVLKTRESVSAPGLVNYGLLCNWISHTRGSGCSGLWFCFMQRKVNISQSWCMSATESRSPRKSCLLTYGKNRSGNICAARTLCFFSQMCLFSGQKWGADRRHSPRTNSGSDHRVW